MRLNWGDELVSTGKLNNMVENDNYLFEKSITGYYNALGIIRDTGLSFRTGWINGLATENMGVTIANYYTKPFLPGARPVIVLGIAADVYYDIFYAVTGLDGRVVPDHRGFNLRAWQNRVQPTWPTRFDGKQSYSYLSIAPNS